MYRAITNPYKTYDSIRTNIKYNTDNRLTVGKRIDLIYARLNNVKFTQLSCIPIIFDANDSVTYDFDEFDCEDVFYFKETTSKIH